MDINTYCWWSICEVYEKEVKVKMDNSLLNGVKALVMGDDRILASVIIGSCARTENIADRYSDIDIIFVTNKPDDFIYSDYWLDTLGSFHISFVEPTLFSGLERRILFDSGHDIDVIVLTEEQSTHLRNGENGEIFERGYIVIKDTIGITQDIGKNTIHSEKKGYILLSEDEYINMINDFWFHVVWTIKKIQRGEVFIAKFCLDNYLMKILLTMIENYETINDKDVWYNGRFIESWAEEWILEGLEKTYTRDSITSALISIMEIFSNLATTVAKLKSFIYPKETEHNARMLFSRLISGEDYL